MIMDQQSKTKNILMIGAVLAAVLGIVLLIVGIIYDGNAVAKVLLILISVLVIALAAELAYLMLLFGEGAKPNYFLYNSKTQRNESLQKLSFQMINSRMNRFLSGYAPSEGKIWTDRVLDNPYLEMESVYKPLVAYKLLYDLAERDMEAGWKCFDLASDETVEFMAIALDMNADQQFATNLRQFKSNKPTNMKAVRDYLVANQKYLQNKMYHYVVDHIDEFEM